MSLPLPPVGRTLRWPLSISLVVLAVRLVGELAGWDPAMFSTAAGGGLSPVGVSWLILVFGFVFGWILTGRGRAPDRPGLSFILHVLGLVTLVAGVLLISQNVEYPVQLGALAGLGLVCLVFAWRGWPELLRYTLLYGLGVRLAVVAVTLVAFTLDWGTHFEKIAPELGEVPNSERLVRLVLAQVVFWVPATVLAGGAFGSIASLVRGRRADDAVDA